MSRFQRRHDLKTTGELGRRTWTSLLAQGGRPLVKSGSGGDAVRRLQRSLNAAIEARLDVDGVFARQELRAVKHYQRETGHPRTGVVTSATWRQLRGGHVASRLPTMTRAQMEGLLDRVRRSTVIPFSSGVDR